VKVTAREPAVEHLPAGCTHPLALDKLGAKFGLQLRRLSCLVCGEEWWDNNGTVIRSTEALGLVAKLAQTPRPSGWAVAEAEWRRLKDESLVPGR
jgi:hypothetical protein